MMVKWAGICVPRTQDKVHKNSFALFYQLKRSKIAHVQFTECIRYIF